MGYDGFISVNKHMDVDDLPAELVQAIHPNIPAYVGVTVSFPVLHLRSYDFADYMSSLGYDADATEQYLSDDDAERVAAWVTTHYGALEAKALADSVGDESLTYRGSV